MDIEFDLGKVKGDTGAAIVSTVLAGSDPNGGNIYRQTFDNGATAEFVAPKGSKGDTADPSVDPTARQNLAAHASDNTSHTTAAERAVWNAKLDKTGGSISGSVEISGSATVIGGLNASNEVNLFGPSGYNDPAPGVNKGLKVHSGGIAVNGVSVINNGLNVKGTLYENGQRVYSPNNPPPSISGGGSDPTLIICDNILGQEVPIVNRIQADINSGRQSLAYRLSGKLNVSDTPKFGTSLDSEIDFKCIFKLDFAANTTCAVTIDFSDCELMEKTLIDSSCYAFLSSTGGGTVTVNGAKPNYSVAGDLYFAFYTEYSTLNATNCTIGGGSYFYGAFYIDNSTLNATNCTTVATYIEGYAFRACYSSTINATNCTTGDNVGEYYTAFSVVNNSTINATNCTTGGSSGDTYNAFYVEDNSTLNITNCSIGGGDGYTYHAFYVNWGGTLNATNCTIGGSS